MIEKIVGATIVPILQELIWSDQIGWLVTPYTRRIETGEGQFSDNIIPVAPNVTVDDCGETSLGMKILTTDQGYRSLILISQQSNVDYSVAANISQRKGQNFDVDIQIAVWLNDHQDTVHIAKGELQRVLSELKFKDIRIPYTGEAPSTMYDTYIKKMQVTFQSDVNSNPFSEYSFGSEYGQFHDTYAAFSLVFHLSGLIFPCALPVYPPLDHGCQFTVTAVAADNTICTGGTTELSITSDLVEADTFQWQVLTDDVWTNVTGATEEAFTPDDFEGSPAYFRVRVTRAGVTATSNTVTITLTPLNVQVTYNQFEGDLILNPGESLNLLAVIFGTFPFTYLWEHLVDDEWVEVPHEEAGGYHIAVADDLDAGVHSYRITAVDANGCTGTSAPFNITVTE